MEIHKPKLARNWREFAIEMGTIICGILIALGLEQTVEWLHQRADVAEARKGLRLEIAHNASMARAVIEQERCLGALEQRMIASGNGEAPTTPRRREARPAGGILGPSKSTWDVVKAGAAAHMTFEERVAYTQFYDLVATDQYNAAPEQEALRRLWGWTAAAAISPDGAQPAVEAAAQAQLQGSIRARLAQNELDAAKAMGITPAALSAEDRKNVATFCGYMGMKPTPAL